MSIFTPLDHLVQVKNEWTTLKSGLYPSFVSGGAGLDAPEDIPVFSFHDVEQDKFGAQLEHLKRNGYRTLTADEYIQAAGRTTNERVVLLTFDDGHASLWKAAYPVLKAYGMKAVAFLLPGELQEAYGVREQRMDHQGDPLITWPEAAAMTDVLDMQSHSHIHQIMFVSDKLTGFHDPAARDKRYLIERPILREGGEDKIDRDYPLGVPIYEMDSRLGEKPRYIEPAAPRQACVKHVTENGGEEYFKRGAWETELGVVHDKAMAEASFTVETKTEREDSIRQMLINSKETIERRLDGCKVTHLCIPFSIGSETTLRLAEEAGYRAAYWGPSPPGFASKSLGMIHVPRIKDDFIFRLPGKGRRALSKIFFHKLKRRLGFGSPFHSPPLGPQKRVPMAYDGAAPE